MKDISIYKESSKMEMIIIMKKNWKKRQKDISKQLKMIVNNIVKAFGKNPDHFCPPIMGGTFKHQT
jgi:hypothetical protein